MKTLERFGLSFLLLSGLSASGVFTSVAVAKTNCTDWMDQGNGTSWTECVGDDGVQHCYKISNKRGSKAYEVACS